ncbi:Prokaryotic membrane lipoprotein lipid attachment site profile (plasmid) [Nostoc flagelliforme CCNUN1]|uniref:Prokaryotic membrane lipoprotein lipid attachment site profile n=1 Tax=Nostoc flagelliforme CCNUN1 TaxID=2038116 RepID=A0A2K8T965_9NOSO|nr:hypothetical protein [Nostoc flagelliforme]AUB44238.1 Prokaryotic membrane lipoprotein lipid attachment site profile [Nostoc flagelliforme CCNUN1]
MKKIFTWIVIGGLISCPLVADANPVVRTIRQSQASGARATIQNIKVWNGNGVSISFYEIKETIKRVWIDDPSQILIDTDGCLEGINSNCQSSGAGLIHLRRINKINIPGLPQSKSTHLTIVTQAVDGQRKAYHFQIIASAGTPEYSQIAIENDSNEQISTSPIRTQFKPRATPRSPIRKLSNLRLPL